MSTTVSLPSLPALVVGAVHHRRHRPIVHDVDFRTYLWLVDVDALPRRWPVATFRLADHLRGDGPSLREEVARTAADAGGECSTGDRLLMLSGARCFGHSFNPLTVYWCLDTERRVRWALFEIHNTYGARHTQLVRPDDEGRAQLRKELYVSPFLTVDGTYDVRLRLDQARVSVDVNLRQDEASVLSARFHGRPRPATRRNVARAALRTPLVMHQTTARIHLHGIRLWLRRLPVVRRPQAPVPGAIR